MSLAQQKPAEQCIKMPSGDASPDGVSQMSLSKNAEKGSVFKSAWARFGFMSSSKPDAQDKEEPQKQKAGPASVPYSTLFRFTSRRDKLHYGFGLVAAAIHGGVIPVWALVFGTLVGKYLSITDLSLVYSGMYYPMRYTPCSNRKSLCHHMGGNIFFRTQRVKILYLLRNGVTCTKPIGQILGEQY